MTETLKAKVERYAKNLAAELVQDGHHHTIEAVTLTVGLYTDGDTDWYWRAEAEGESEADALTFTVQ